MDIRKRARQIIDDRTRITAVFMLIVVLMFLLVSTCFIAHEADHECTGEDCPICALIQISENNLRQLGSGAPAAAAAVSLILTIVVMQLGTDGGIIRDRTDVFPYECYDENTGEYIGSCWSIEETEELCRSKSCSTNLIPVEQARQLLQHMRKQRFKMRKKR